MEVKLEAKLLISVYCNCNENWYYFKNSNWSETGIIPHEPLMRSRNVSEVKSWAHRKRDSSRGPNTLGPYSLGPPKLEEMCPIGPVWCVPMSVVVGAVAHEVGGVCVDWWTCWAVCHRLDTHRWHGVSPHHRAPCRAPAATSFAWNSSDTARRCMDVALPSAAGHVVAGSRHWRMSPGRHRSNVAFGISHRASQRYVAAVGRPPRKLCRSGHRHDGVPDFCRVWAECVFGGWPVRRNLVRRCRRAEVSVRNETAGVHEDSAQTGRVYRSDHTSMDPQLVDTLLHLTDRLSALTRDEVDQLLSYSGQVHHIQLMMAMVAVVAAAASQ